MERGQSRLVLVAAVCLSGMILVACGDSGTTTTPPDDAVVTTPTDSTSTPNDESSTTSASASGQSEAILLTHVVVPGQISWVVQSCTQSGETGVVLEATNPDDPNVTLVVDAPSGTGTLKISEGDVNSSSSTGIVSIEVEFQAMSDDDREFVVAFFDLSEELPGGSVKMSSDRGEVYVACG